MKLILDFDDVLFNNTKQFKKHMFGCIEELGISRAVAEAYYKETRGTDFSLKFFLSALFAREGIKIIVEDLYEKIMSKCEDFFNLEVLALARKMGKENCYLVTMGNGDFQKDKVERSGAENLFAKIYAMPGSKREAIEEICADNKHEKIIFVDDKERFFEDLNMDKCKNLKTVLFDENGLIKLMEEIKQNSQ